MTFLQTIEDIVKDITFEMTIRFKKPVLNLKDTYEI